MSDETDEHKKKIKEELEKLKYEYKIQIPKRIATARAYGDLKENAEYHAARERQGFVKARISQLSLQYSQLNNIDKSRIAKDRVGFGSNIIVLDLDSKEKIEFKFVTSSEVNPSDGKISISSPIGLALQNKFVGDEVEISTPVGKKKFLIEKLITIHGNEYTS